MWQDNLDNDVEIISKRYLSLNNYSSSAGGFDFDHYHYYHKKPNQIRFKTFSKYLINIFVNTEYQESCLNELFNSETFKTIMIAYMRSKNIEELLPKKEINILNSNDYYSDKIGFNINHMCEYLDSNNIKNLVDINIFLFTSYCLIVGCRTMIYFNNNQRLPEWFNNKQFDYVNGGKFSYTVIQKIANLELNKSMQDLNGKKVWLDCFTFYNPMDHIHKLYLLGKAFELI